MCSTCQLPMLSSSYNRTAALAPPTASKLPDITLSLGCSHVLGSHDWQDIWIGCDWCHHRCTSLYLKILSSVAKDHSPRHWRLGCCKPCDWLHRCVSIPWCIQITDKLQHWSLPDTSPGLPTHISPIQITDKLQHWSLPDTSPGLSTHISP